MSSLTSRVCAIVVSYNESKALVSNLALLKNQVEKIIIVDNGSGESTQHDLNLFIDDPKFLLIRLERNFGIGRALNEGVTVAQKEGFHWILTLDQDSVPDLTMVAKLLCGINTFGGNQLGIFTPRILSRPPQNEVATNRVLPYSITSGNFINIKTFEKVGRYNEDYFIDCVDFEFSLRIRENGYQIVEIPQAYMIHNIGISNTHNWITRVLGFSRHVPLRRYYMTRNHFYLITRFWKYFPLFVLKKNISFMLLVFKIVLFEDKKIKNIHMIYCGFIDFFKNRTGNYYDIRAI